MVLELNCSVMNAWQIITCIRDGETNSKNTETKWWKKYLETRFVTSKSHALQITVREATRNFNFVLNPVAPANVSTVLFPPLFQGESDPVKNENNQSSRWQSCLFLFIFF